MCVGGRGGGGGGKLPRVGVKIPGLSCPWGTSCPGDVGVGQDKLLHWLKLDTDEETNHLTELSYNKYTAIDERLNYLGYWDTCRIFSPTLSIRSPW